MNFSGNLLRFSMEKPKWVTGLMVVMTLILGVMMVRVQVDTDPENMLSADEAVRVFHHQTKETFNLHDVVVLGIVNEADPDGVFNPETLGRVNMLTHFAMNLSDPDNPGKRVVTRNVIAPGTVDAIIQAGPGQVNFEWLMSEPPRTRQEALEIRDIALSNPLLNGTMVSADGKAIAIYLPITAKDFAYQVRQRLLEKISTLPGDDRYYITGLPVAEDTFGVEMFTQMAISAPLAMLAIFLLMLVFFKRLSLIISPLIIAMVTVICTMGLLIGTGNTVHIMSSMIPIFLMPIAVVDSIHILSEFFDTYRKNKDRRKTLAQVMGHLFMPMLYTSLTSSAGFASLALTPIPPVRVFGMFVAFGIMLAWLLTILFIPAYVMLLKDTRLAKLGSGPDDPRTLKDMGVLSRFLRQLGHHTYTRSKLILSLTVLCVGIAIYGISQIRINDNPVKWFHETHEIRVSDRVLNDHFHGTYEAYLVLGDASDTFELADAIAAAQAIALHDNPVMTQTLVMIQDASENSRNASDFLDRLGRAMEAAMDAASDEEYDMWADALDALAQVKNRGQIFKQPAVLNYIATLQAHLQQFGGAGKSNSITDVVKKVHQELFEADPAHYRVPDTVNAVAQSLISFQNSHKPDDLWHLVTPDYTRANIWVQLKTGDNRDMEATVRAVADFFENNPPPVPLSHQWAGLTYINVVWQNKMVAGMLKSFLSSFAVVFIMMTILFRSPLWGLLAMVPLSVTIALIYGIIGIIGKDYDMPVAVLSSLTLGLAVDFAIHFLERSRKTYQQTGSWQSAAQMMFEEPARAISRNVIVIAIGFTPLLLAPLVPYQTVGVFLASIMAISGLATIFILPALIKTMESWLFKGRIRSNEPILSQDSIR